LGVVSLFLYALDDDADDADDFGFALVLFAYITNVAVFRWIGFDFWVDEVLSSIDSPATTDAGCRMLFGMAVRDDSRMHVFH